MDKFLTKEQVNKKYKGKYIEIYKQFDYDVHDWKYKIIKVYSVIHENTTLGEDVGTAQEYCR